MSTLADAIAKSVTKVTKDFTKEKRIAASYRTDYLSDEQIQRLRDRAAKDELDKQIKHAAFEVMEKAYLIASGNGSLPANARQIMYAARPFVLEITGGKCWTKSSYFTQVLVPDYIETHPEQTGTWDVVYDARGHLVEPHVRYRIGIGTLEVRSYMNSWDNGVDNTLGIMIDELYPTRGPVNRFETALFIEKEGFDPLLERSQIAQRYDLAIFSTKGMSNTAARKLVDALSDHGVTILVAHDFDLSGLTIVHTLGHDTRRYKFKNEPNVIDIGLRLDDVPRLQSEPVLIKQKKDPREKFLYGDDCYDYDVTQRELDFLVERQVNSKQWQGKRVELNALSAPQFIEWLESKLNQYGVEKVVPDEETLRTAYRRAQRIAKIQALIDEVDKADDSAVEVPENLEDSVRKYLEEHATKSWDQALCQLTKGST